MVDRLTANNSWGNDGKTMVTVKDMAKNLCCSVRNVWRLHSSGKIPAPVRIGKSVRWIVATLDEWVEKGCPDRATFEARRRVENGGKRNEC